MSDLSNGAAPNPIINIRNVAKHYGDVRALDGVSVEIEEGEFFSLLGPSGCGKTTLLRMIAGFDEPTSGTISIGGEPMAGVPANLRPTNMVFQNYAIFPHLTVAENVAYGLQRRKLPNEIVQKEVEASLDMVDLGGFGSRASHAMSGGQRQRVALARALIMRPKVLLLDEPLSALDKKLREQMQVELRRLQRAVGITFILVTHDQEEALIMSDRIAVMFDGRIAQLATPQELYQLPANRKVASFIGVMNLLDGRFLGETGDQVQLEIAALGQVSVPKSRCKTQITVAGSTHIGIRPEMLTILFDDSEQSEREVIGTVSDVVYYGDMTYYDVQLPDVAKPVTVSMRNTAGRSVLDIGATTRIGWGAESVVVLD